MTFLERSTKKLNNEETNIWGLLLKNKQTKNSRITKIRALHYPAYRKTLSSNILFVFFLRNSLWDTNIFKISFQSAGKGVLLRNRQLDQWAEETWQKPQCANERKWFINQDHSHKFTMIVNVCCIYLLKPDNYWKTLNAKIATAEYGSFTNHDSSRPMDFLTTASMIHMSVRSKMLSNHGITETSLQNISFKDAKSQLTYL